jgi:hypothetical protein
VPLPEKLLKEPLPTVTSPAAKLVVDSLEVNDTEIDEELLVAPLPTVELAIDIVGPVVSMTNVGIVTEPALPDASVTVTVSPLYVPSPSALNVIVLLPVTAEEEVENSSAILEVIVPASSLLKTKLGVTFAAGVEIAVTEESEGAAVSIVTLPVPLVTAIPGLLVPFFVSPKAIL